MENITLAPGAHCAACGQLWGSAKQMGPGDPSGGILICLTCGHLNGLTPAMELCNLRREVRDNLRKNFAERHPVSLAIYEAQQRVVEKLWG